MGMLLPATRDAMAVPSGSKGRRLLLKSVGAGALASLAGCATDPAKPGALNRSWSGQYRPFAAQALLGEGRQVTLLGGLHSGLPGFYPLPAGLQALWSQADCLMVEIDAKSRHAELVEAFRPAVRLPAGISLENLIPDPLLTQARQLFNWSPQRWQELRIMQPWWVANFAFSTPLPDPRWVPDSSQGLEPILLDQARKRNIPILELEPPAAQVEALSSLPLADQADQFVAWLRDIQSHGPMWPQLVQAWSSGQTDTLARLKARWWGQPADPRLGSLHKVAFERRDAEMANSLAEQLQLVQPRHAFVLVGAFHMVGPGNLLEQLALRGLQFWRLNYNSGL